MPIKNLNSKSKPNSQRTPVLLLAANLQYATRGRVVFLNVSGFPPAGIQTRCPVRCLQFSLWPSKF